MSQSPNEETNCDPKNIYGSLKFGGEKLARAYSNVFGFPVTRVRPSALYGPRCISRRVLQVFIENALRGQNLSINGDGQESLDFTYIDDLIEAVYRLAILPPVEGAPMAGAVDTLSPVAPFRIVNIAGGDNVGLERYIDAVEQALGKKATRNLLPMQTGDIPQTYADAQLLEAITGYRPSTSVEIGVKAFVDWHLQHFA